MAKYKVISVFLALLIGLSSCAAPIEESDEFEPVARLYTEMLWRDLDESDNATLKMCSKAVKDKINETNANAKELRRKSEYLTKDEVHQLIGDLTEYYQGKIDEFLALQEMASFNGSKPLTIEDYEPIMILTKDEYEVERIGNDSYVLLEDGNKVYCKVYDKYKNGVYDIFKVSFKDGVYKYKVELEDDTVFYLYLDTKNHKVERLKESET